VGILLFYATVNVIQCKTSVSCMKCEVNFDLGWSFQRLGWNFHRLEWSSTLVWNEARLWSGTEFLFFSGTGFIFCLERSSYFAWNGALERSCSWSGTELTCFSIFAAEPGGGVPVPAGGAGETLWALPHRRPSGRESQGSKQVPTPAGELIKVHQAERARAANRYQHQQESS
jgi:hypothetical protein